MCDLKKLKLTRASCKATLTRIQTFVEDPLSLASATVQALQARKDKLITLLNQFESVQLDILDIDDKDSEDVGLFQDRYFSTLAKINESIEMLTKSESSKSTCSSTSKLPNVDIPSFDGKDFIQFKPFYELFIAVIDNNSTLTDVQKLFYLRKYLLDEALCVIINLPLVNQSYKEALELLRKRYDNKTRLICTYINLLLDIPSIQKCTAACLRTFVSQIKQQLHALKGLDEPVHNWDRLLLCVLSRKLDIFTHRAFHLDRDPDVLPTMAEFIAFLDKRAMALEDTIPLKGQYYENKFKPAVLVSNITTHPNFVCCYCNKKDHAIFCCPIFKLAPVKARLKFVSEHKLCCVCLRAHPNSVCKYKFKCKICKESHNTLLHSNEKEPVSLCSNNSLFSNCSVLLPTVKVKVTDKYGRDFIVRALLDSGSQTSFITDTLVKKLSLVPSSQSTNIIGISNRITKINEIVNLPINSCMHKNVKFNVNCYVVNTITTPQPQQLLDVSKLNIPGNIKLSDNEFYVPTEISLLLGADIYFDSLLNGSIKLLNGPVLQNTVFGYIVAGKTCSNSDNLCSNVVSNFVICDERKVPNEFQKTVFI